MDLRAKAGRVVSTSLQHFAVRDIRSPSPPGKYAEASYKTVFTNAMVTETFFWIVSDSPPRLAGYHADSSRLKLQDDELSGGALPTWLVNHNYLLAAVSEMPTPAGPRYLGELRDLAPDAALRARRPRACKRSSVSCAAGMTRRCPGSPKRRWAMRPPTWSSRSTPTSRH